MACSVCQYHLSQQGTVSMHQEHECVELHWGGNYLVIKQQAQVLLNTVCQQIVLLRKCRGSMRANH